MPPFRCFRLAVLSITLALTVGWEVARAEPPAAFPPEARDRFDQARDFQKNGQFQEAITAFEEAKKLGMQSYPRAHLYQAGSYLGLKDYDGAIARYTKFIADFGIEESCRY
jgi:tetratricopeptide (TPR) repeat protein